MKLIREKTAVQMAGLLLNFSKIFIGFQESASNYNFFYIFLRIFSRIYKCFKTINLADLNDC